MSQLLSIRANAEASEVVQTQAEGTSKKEEKMARKKLSLEDQLRGVKAALKSKRTPPQFRDGLRRRKEELQKKIGAPRQAAR
jgi:hypothetical protein